MTDSPLATLGAFAARLTFEDLPQAVVDRACLTLLDTVAAICAGRSLPEMQALANWQASQGNGPALQALSLAGAGVAHELDEGFAPARGHPSIHLVPVLLGEAAARCASGRDLITAMVAGYEVAARVGVAVELRPGMHPHGTWGALGAAAAICRLRGASPETTKAALELAACMPVATTYQVVRDGSPVRHVWAGLANLTGAMAADLAGNGFPPPTTAAIAVMSEVIATGFDAAAATSSLGTRWDILRGYFKMHACCRHGHAAMDAIDVALNGAKLDPAHVKSVRVWAYADSVSAMTPTLPVTTILAAKFSIPFMVALRLIRGSTDPALFIAGIATDPELTAFARKVTLEEDPELTRRGRERRGSRVELTLADGRVLKAEVEHSRGDPAIPFGRDDIIAKYRRLAGATIGAQSGATLEQAILSLPALSDSSVIMQTLAGTGAQA